MILFTKSNHKKDEFLISNSKMQKNLNNSTQVLQKFPTEFRFQVTDLQPNHKLLTT